MRSDLTLDLGNGLHLRALVPDDAALLVAATRGESAPSLWGPRPAGPYSLPDARAALAAWDPAAGGQYSLGILDSQQLLGAVGLMPDQPGSAELAYWIRPGQRGRGIASRAGYHFEQRLSQHCRDWATEDAGDDSWHDCLIWAHVEPESRRS